MIYSISADNYRLNIIILLCQLFLLINRFHLFFFVVADCGVLMCSPSMD